MSDESNKLDSRAAGYVMRFIRNGDDHREDECVVELADRSGDEVELAFTFDRDRYYLRMRTADLRRLLREAQP